ncbi:cytochrome b [Cellvibrio fontiphilus]|uniref:Cytochrome b n=1 Tax=Cellvibrio fontiphilus TaxID=1815559 RepID=A0ABV7FCU3_9GAMM
MLKDSSTGYGLIAILLHWSSALLILFLFGLGIYMTGLGYYDDWYHKGPALHISLGLIVLLLMLVRVIWRLLNPTPVALGDKPAQLMAAKLVKWALYLAIFVVLITGYFITTAEGKPASLFDWIYFPSIAELSASQVDLVGELHEYFAWGIIGLVVLHVGGALLHHFVIRDRTLVRMLKPVKK